MLAELNFPDYTRLNNHEKGYDFDGIEMSMDNYQRI
jgi:hypothetical protein